MSQDLISPEGVLQQLHWRYATKKFDPTRKIPQATWQALEEVMVLAPSSFGLQPWKFIVVDDPQIRQQLVEHSWGQPQVVDASHLVVFAIKKDVNAADVDRYAQSMSEIRQVPLDSLQGMTKMIKGFIATPPYPLDLNEWAARQVYLALGQFMTGCALLGIDTCPMEGFNPAKYNEILDLQGYAVVVVCPAGYRAEGDKYAVLPKVRYPLADLVQHI